MCRDRRLEWESGAAKLPGAAPEPTAFPSSGHNFLTGTLEGLDLISSNKSVFSPAQALCLVLPSLSHLQLEGPRERTQDTQLWAGTGGGEAQNRDTGELGSGGQVFPC